MALIQSSQVQRAVLAAYSAKGYAVNENFVGLKQEPGAVRFSIRIGRGRNPLPSGGYLDEQAGKGNLAPGSVEGAFYFVFGMVQSTGDQIRVTTRLVQVESGVVQAAAKVDGKATQESLESAIREALKRLEPQLVC